MVLAGCAHTSAVDRHDANHRAEIGRATQPPWKSLINELFAGRRIEHRYSCAAALAAIEDFRSGNATYRILHRYMLRACWVQLHPARPARPLI